jgi:hypothetical protein
MLPVTCVAIACGDYNNLIIFARNSCILKLLNLAPGHTNLLTCSSVSPLTKSFSDIYLSSNIMELFKIAAPL